MQVCGMAIFAQGNAVNAPNAANSHAPLLNTGGYLTHELRIATGRKLHICIKESGKGANHLALQLDLAKECAQWP
jgi:hypothetical protein